MKVVVEGEFAVLYEDADWWIVEDKIAAKFPMVGRSSTKSFVQIYVDFVETPDGLKPARWYLPKSIPLRFAMDTFNRIENKRKREFEKLKAYMEVSGGAVQGQPY